MKGRLAKGDFVDYSDYAIHYKTLNKSTVTHWHNFYEFDIIVSGNGKTVCNGKKYALKRGMVSLLSPLDFHEYIISEDVKIINVQFRERDISCDLLDRLSFVTDKVVFLDEDKIKIMEKLSELIRRDLKGNLSEQYRKRIIECMIISFLDFVDNKKSSGIVHSSIKRAVVYLNTHFYENPSMKEIADKFYLNPSYFSRAFKENTGVTYKEYLRKLKLEYSRTLIKHTDLSLIDIAVKSGYETQSHFNREFKEYYGITPTKLRK